MTVADFKKSLENLGIFSPEIIDYLLKINDKKLIRIIKKLKKSNIPRELYST